MDRHEQWLNKKIALYRQGGENMASIVGLVDKEYEEKTSAELLEAPLVAISGISEEDAQKLKEAFNVETIGAFAELQAVKAVIQILEWAKTAKPAEAVPPPQ